jgi:hypothetical protein
LFKARCCCENGIRCGVETGWWAKNCVLPLLRGTNDADRPEKFKCALLGAIGTCPRTIPASLTWLPATPAILWKRPL